LLEVEGFNQKVVRFTSAIPHLLNWGKPLLLGSGSILVAHTKYEFVRREDLEKAVEFYVNFVKKLLATINTNNPHQIGQYDRFWYKLAGILIGIVLNRCSQFSRHLYRMVAFGRD